MPRNTTKSKRRVYLGCVLALWGGFLFGMGLAGVFIPRAIISQVLAVDANVRLNLENYNYYQLWAASAIIVGIILAGFGFYFQRQTSKKIIPASS